MQDRVQALLGEAVAFAIECTETELRDRLRKCQDDQDKLIEFAGKGKLRPSTVSDISPRPARVLEIAHRELQGAIAAMFHDRLAALPEAENQGAIKAGDIVEHDCLPYRVVELSESSDRGILEPVLGRYDLTVRYTDRMCSWGEYWRDAKKESE
jgi:hypothetical protein